MGARMLRDQRNRAGLDVARKKRYVPLSKHRTWEKCRNQIFSRLCEQSEAISREIDASLLSGQAHEFLQIFFYSHLVFDRKATNFFENKTTI